MISKFTRAMAGLKVTKTQGVILASGILGCALLCLGPAEKVEAENPQNGNPTTLTGSWVMAVGMPPGPTFTAFETFTEGGGSVETNNGPGSGPVAPGIGTWVRTGHRTFLATFWR